MLLSVSNSGQKDITFSKKIKISGNVSLFGSASYSSDSNVVVNPYSYGVSISTSLKPNTLHCHLAFDMPAMEIMSPIRS